MLYQTLKSAFKKYMKSKTKKYVSLIKHENVLIFCFKNTFEIIFSTIFAQNITFKESELTRRAYGLIIWRLLTYDHNDIIKALFFFKTKILVSLKRYFYSNQLLTKSIGSIMESLGKKGCLGSLNQGVCCTIFWLALWA